MSPASACHASFMSSRLHWTWESSWSVGVWGNILPIPIIWELFPVLLEVQQ